MARYLIDTDDGEHAFEGDGSVSFDTVEEARAEAHKALGLMIVDVMPDGEQRTFNVKVQNEQGQPVYTATLTLQGAWMVPLPR